jgi:DUF1680 family protein
MPGWCRKPAICVNGRPVNPARVARKGYACLRRVWQKGDRIELTLPMPVERVEAHPAVRMDCGEVALQRGPVVYCLEEVDNGSDLNDIVLPRNEELRARFAPRLLGGVVAIMGRGRRREASPWEKGDLYRTARSKTRIVPIRAVPYSVWGNRRPGEMVVWIREEQSQLKKST